jgi:hypothetical protein
VPKPIHPSVGELLLLDESSIPFQRRVHPFVVMKREYVV